MARRRVRGKFPRTHGEGYASAEYRAWHNMRDRCRRAKHPAYKDYGQRGITVCRRWHRYENFLADMGRKRPRTTLERKNNNKGYSPSNCYWATTKEQGRNKRNTVRLTYLTVSLSLKEWAEQRHIKYATLHWRLKHNWPIARLLGYS